MSDFIFSNEGNALKVQRDQLSKIGKAGIAISAGLDRASALHSENADDLAVLMAEAERMCAERGVSSSDARDLDTAEVDALLASMEIGDGEIKKAENIRVEKIDIVDACEDWGCYLANIHEYAAQNNINLSEDPFRSLLTPEERREIVQRIEDDYKLHGEANCDKWDYVLAGICGIVSGFVDSFFVGMPGASKLGNVVDSVADKAVEKFAKFTNWCDKKQVEKLVSEGKISGWGDFQPTGCVLQKEVKDGNVASAIGYLEKRFSVPYDARYAKDLINADGVSFNPKDHHLKYWRHFFDPIGLFMSSLDRFTGMTTIIADGKIKRFKHVPSSREFHLQGTNFYTKVLYGFINWIGHIMSDVAGSSGTRGHVGKRGSGIAAPFFEMFQLCNFGSFDVDGDQKTLAELTSSMYAHGYDARFVAAQAIPVALNEVLIRLCWSIKRHYYHGLPWKDCVPLKVSDKPELRRMLLVGHGCLCLVDAADAAIRSWGNLMGFMLHLNIVAWGRFAHMGYLEIRAMYNKDALNTEAMESDLKAEWDVLLTQSEV